MGKTVNLAVFVAGLDEEYQNNIITGINDFAKRSKINVTYFAAYGGMLDSKVFDIGEYSMYDVANLEYFDGVILMTNTINDVRVKERIINNVKTAKLPAVVFDCADYPEFINISIDNSAAMRNMVRHVIQEHGAKILNYISGPMSNPEAVDRLNAFREVMAENNLPVEEGRIFYGEFRPYDGKAAIEQYMESGLALPDAFICANDAMALTAVSTLEKYGFCVPLDVIVTGFDNTYSARNYCPALTSVKRPLDRAGSEACRVLLDIIDGKELEVERMEAECVFTESCGCNSGGVSEFSEYRKRTYNKIEDSNDNIHKLNILSARLAETENTDDTFAVIRDFIADIGCERFALCLKEDWQDAFANTSANICLESDMTAPLIWDKGETTCVEYFTCRSMYPEPLETAGNVSYFIPLHFKERALGYFIITNGDFPITNLLCHSFAMDISNSLENLRKLSHINKAMEELNRLYVIDPLCNVYNRNGFIKLADDMFRTSVSQKRKIMLTFIDMDGLKFINDNFGHNEGDFAIQRLADVIKECLKSDSICARFGGDEFVVFHQRASDGDEAAFERRLNTKIDSINSIICKPYTLSASVGSVIKVPGEDETLYSIIKQADALMYEVKKAKKNSRAGTEEKK
ncbi:MAG: diguanylate cyclase [Ruminococcus sp.]|nr:diguanylate cyclase [Ruminococcus sp.]